MDIQSLDLPNFQEVRRLKADQRELPKLHLALKDGEIVHVRDVQRGLECGCICPDCDARLIAKKGTDRIYHFAHYDAPEHSGALESALHRAAKQVILQERRLCLPELPVEVSEKDLDGNVHSVSGMVVNEQTIAFDSAQEEVEFNAVDIKADVVGRAGNRALIIEVFVTHRVDDDKHAKLAALGMEALEIDLSGLNHRDVDLETIKEAVIEHIQHKKWLHHPGMAAIEERLREELKSRIDLANQEIEIRREQERAARELERQRLEAARIQEQRRLQTRRAMIATWLSQFEEYQKPDGYLDWKKRYCAQTRRSCEASSQWLNIKFNQLPNFLNTPITGEEVFACDRRVWQAAIFVVWLCRPAPEKAIGKLFRATFVTNWCQGRSNLPIPHFIRQLGRNRDLLTAAQLEILPDTYRVVRSFLEKLAELGFLRRAGGDGFVVARNELESPAKDESAIMNSSLRYIHWCHNCNRSILSIQRLQAGCGHCGSHAATQPVNLYGLTLDELREAADDDWEEVTANFELLEAFTRSVAAHRPSQ